MIRPGDVLKQCSAVFGDDMWECRDLQRTRWAINNRVGKVGVWGVCVCTTTGALMTT
jgi:hypothetical protein